MLDSTFGNEWKPERAKFVLYFQQNNMHLQLAVDPAFSNAWTRAPFYARIKTWARDGAEHGRFVFVRIGQRLIVVLPDRDAEVGDVGPEDQVMITRRLGPAGFDYSIELKRGSRDAPTTHAIPQLNQAPPPPLPFQNP
jgi:hypothetical protein